MSRSIKYRFLIIIISLYHLVAVAQTGSYKMGEGDRVSITFWQEPDLNMEEIIDGNGNISLPLGGEIKAAGLTQDELAEAVVERISVFNKRISSAQVKILEYGNRKIYIMGNVAKPGKYTFESIPNLWDIISEAGGPTSEANLSNIMIIRGGENGDANTINVDLVDILRNNNLSELPSIKSGDNIYVPAVVGNLPSVKINAVQPRENVLYIGGEVNTPGVYTYSKELSLLEALYTAGGPTSMAKLDEVRVIRQINGYSRTTQVNVKRYTKKDLPISFKLKGGDTIFVPKQNIITENIILRLITIAANAAFTSAIYYFIFDRSK